MFQSLLCLFTLLLIHVVCIIQGRNALEKVCSKLGVPSVTRNQLSFKEISLYFVFLVNSAQFKDVCLDPM